MNPDQWALIFAGDIAACKTVAVLQEYGRRWRVELARHEMADELRRVYKERLALLTGIESPGAPAMEPETPRQKAIT